MTLLDAFFIGLFLGFIVALIVVGRASPA